MDRLRELLEQLETITNELNASIDERTKFNNELAVAKASVEKNEHKKKLIEQQIMCEKKLMEIR